MSLADNTCIPCRGGVPPVPADRAQALDVELLHIRGRGLQDDLVLKVFAQTERVVAVASVRGAPRGLDVGHAPGLGAQDAQESVGVHGARADFQVERLLDHAPLRRPETLEAQN